MSQKPGGAAGQVSTANRSIHPLCDPKTEAGTHQTHSPPRSNLQTFQLTSLNYPDVFSLRGEVLREKPRRRWLGESKNFAQEADSAGPPNRSHVFRIFAFHDCNATKSLPKMLKSYQWGWNSWPQLLVFQCNNVT